MLGTPSACRFSLFAARPVISSGSPRTGAPGARARRSCCGKPVSPKGRLNLPGSRMVVLVCCRAVEAAPGVEGALRVRALRDPDAQVEAHATLEPHPGLDQGQPLGRPRRLTGPDLAVDDVEPQLGPRRPGLVLLLRPDG